MFNKCFLIILISFGNSLVWIHISSFPLVGDHCATRRPLGGRNVWVVFYHIGPTMVLLRGSTNYAASRVPIFSASYPVLVCLWTSQCSSSIQLYPSLVLEFPPLFVTIQRDCLWMLPLWYQCLTSWIGFDPRKLQPVESQHTDYATRPTENQISPHKSRMSNWRIEVTFVNMSKCRNNIKIMT
jgi:hypothetical protein